MRAHPNLADKGAQPLPSSFASVRPMAASTFAMAHQAMADIKLDNIMLRAASNELVVADPICDHFFEISDGQRAQMMMRTSS